MVAPENPRVGGSIPPLGTISLNWNISSLGAPRRSAEIRATVERGSCQDAGDALNDLARELAVAADARGATVLMVVDQLEEALTNPANERAARFLPLLAAALQAEANQLIVLGTLRSDFLALLQKQPAMRDLRFASVEQFVEAYAASEDVDLIQLSPGPLDFTSTQVELGGLGDALGV